MKITILTLAMLFMSANSFGHEQSCVNLDPPCEAGNIDARLVKAEADLICLTEELGPAHIEGTTSIACPGVFCQTVPFLHFGEKGIAATQTKGNTIVDEVQCNNGSFSTLFVKSVSMSGTSYVRVSTNILLPPPSPPGIRALGTVLDPTSAAYAAINAGDSFIGPAIILGLPYHAAYVPIRDTSPDTCGDVIGIYFVGYRVQQPCPCL